MHAAIVVVLSPLRRAAIAILRTILKTTTRLRHLSVNPILQKTMSDYGKILKYQEKYRETDISVDPYLKDILQKLETLSVVIILHLNP